MRTTVPGVRTLVLIAAFLALAPRSFSQSIVTPNGKTEIGLYLGPIIFLGDLGGLPGIGQSTGPKDIGYALTKTKFVKGIFVQYYPSEIIGISVAFNLGELEAFDSTINIKGGYEVARWERNEDFKSTLKEGSITIDVFPTVPFERYDGLKGKFRPFITGGVGIFHANPLGLYYPNYGSASSGSYGKPTGPYEWVPLTPLHLEGQGFPGYTDRKTLKPWEPELIIGGGFKYYVSEGVSLGLQLKYNKTFTDQVDAVSADYIDPNLFGQYLNSTLAAQARQIYFRSNMLTPAPRPQPVVGEKRGDPTQNDAFFSTTLRLAIRLNRDNTPRNMRCPTFY